ncbi:MAG: integrase core domain-containing protein [Verrucomicrobiia bacterium]
MSQNPNEGWMKQTARNVTSSDGPLVGARYLIHDRDAKYTQSFDQILKAAGTAVIRLPPQSPNLNAFAERFVKTIKTECLEQFVLFGEESLRHVIREYLAHYHAERNHQGIKNVIPFPDRRLEAREGRIEKAEWLGWAAELLPPPGRLPKFKVRLCDPSVISRLRRFVSRHTGLDAPDDIAEPKRRFVPVVLVWLVESRAPTSDEYVDLTGSTAT